MDCCGKVTAERRDSILTTVNVPDVPTRATTIFYVPHRVGNEPENWIRSFDVLWDDIETVDQIMERMQQSYNLLKSSYILTTVKNDRIVRIHTEQETRQQIRENEE